MRSEEEIQAQIDIALEMGNKFHGMTYKEGIVAALEWVMGQRDETPTED